MNEIWKTIKNYPDYKVSSLGRIKSLKFDKNIILSGSVDGEGYITVTLYKNGGKTLKVHQLVAIAFLNHTPNGKTMVVDHINFNKTDNHLENLRIITSRENGNQKHLKSTSKYVGVHWHKASKKWQAMITIRDKRKYLGIFSNELDAHYAYQNELQNLTQSKNFTPNSFFIQNLIVF